MRKVANVERAQLLMESKSRKHLQLFLAELKEVMHTSKLNATNPNDHILTLPNWFVEKENL